MKCDVSDPTDLRFRCRIHQNLEDFVSDPPNLRLRCRIHQNIKVFIWSPPHRCRIYQNLKLFLLRFIRHTALKREVGLEDGEVAGAVGLVQGKDVAVLLVRGIRTIVHQVAALPESIVLDDLSHVRYLGA
jgi:hypothetical protein